MPTTCEFQLNNPNAVYYSGDTVSALINLKTTSAKDVRNVSIIFRGEGKVCWSEIEKQRKSDGSYINHTVYFRSKDFYVNKTVIVRGEGRLPIGTHTYTFEIFLPPHCPTSCEGRYGNIRYELMLNIERPLHFNNEFSKLLSVIKPQDLNLNPAFRIPIESEDTFSSCCWSCLGGKINCIVKIPFAAYAIGQSVKYSLYIQNQSMNDIIGYTREFCRRITFTAQTPYDKILQEATTLRKKCYDIRCLRLTTRALEGNFRIVSTPPSTEGENIIHVRYEMKISLHIGGCSKDYTIIVPIFIGTIALRESILPAEPLEHDRLIAIAPSAPELSSDVHRDNDLPPSYQELCPPSFEEATRSSSPFMDTDYNQHNRPMAFRPLYPSYSQNDDSQSDD